MLFVGRRGPVAQLSQWLEGEGIDPHTGPLRVGTIYGPGGIGKTFLLDSCLRGAAFSSSRTPSAPKVRENLEIRMDGRKDIRSIEGWLGEELPLSSRPAIDANPKWFRRLRQSAEALRWIRQRAEAQLLKETLGDGAFQACLLHLLSFGLLPERALAQHPYDVKLVQLPYEELERAVEVIKQLQAFQPEREWLGGLRKGPRLRNALRADVEGVLAQQLIDDLNDIFTAKGAPKELLWIFDDYESIEPVLGDFLVSHVLDKLKAAGFPSLLLFIGRDNLLSTHTAWGQHYRPLLGERLIELKPFGHQEALELMRRRGVVQTEMCERIWEETQGYPFLLDLECEDALSGGRSALGLKLFFERLTRWMTPIQKEWIVPMSFLEEINLESVSQMMPRQHPDAVLDWFKSEPAIRDPHAPVWRVLPFVRTRIQQYVKNDSPRLFASLLEKSKAVAKALQNEV